MVVSSLYLVWGLSAQAYVTNIAEENLAESHQQGDVLVTAGPFNTLLWRVLVMQESGCQEGFYSLLDPDRKIEFTEYPNQPELLGELQDHRPVGRLQRFSKGFLKVENTHNNDLVVSDLRIGVEPSYVFSFKVAELTGDGLKPVDDQRVHQSPDWDHAMQLLQRIVSRDN